MNDAVSVRRPIDTLDGRDAVVGFLLDAIPPMRWVSEAAVG